MQVVERVWEWHFAASPEALWPLLADTARIGEAAGFPRYTITDIEQPDGTVRRIGSARRLRHDRHLGRGRAGMGRRPLVQPRAPLSQPADPPAR